MLLNIEQINLQSMFLCKEIRLSKKNQKNIILWVLQEYGKGLCIKDIKQGKRP